MANLSSFVTITAAGAKHKQIQLAVTNSNEGSGVQNGGVCCCFVRPANTNWIQFELWGSGGDGGGMCCCSWSCMSGGYGTYSKVTLNSNLCAYYNLCVGGSGCCNTACWAGNGFPSFVTNPLGTIVACAAGGKGGCAGWQNPPGNYVAGFQSCTSVNCFATIGDFSMPSNSPPTHQHSFCAAAFYTFQSGAIKYASNTRHSLDHCAVGWATSGCSLMASRGTQFPGGGGISGGACGSCCWASWGTGGLVLITYG